MVEITKITDQKNKGKFNLFVDGEFYAGVLKEVAIANNFFVGKQLDKKELDDILIESETKQAFSKASDYLGTRLHTKFELRTKLSKKGYSKEAIRGAINRLENYGYIDDKAFAMTFVNSNAKLSKKMLENKLLSKGVSKEIVSKVLAGLSAEYQYQSCQVAAQKYLKGKNMQEAREKLYAHLVRKGYDYACISKIIKQIYNVDFDFGE